ncbi:MAG: hypothetical protein MUE44_22250 [Oscillatoriaceae cyanobacterium Prado104]|jgi:hypothetical protein|nr:hypothetical protein [Oscillatoriaceae cyanobacterium Prado104]
MTEAVTHYRRIDRLKARALELGFTNTDAKEFGKLSKTATWEALLNFYEVDTDAPTFGYKSLDTIEYTPIASDSGQIVSSNQQQSLDTADCWTNDGTFPVHSIDVKTVAAGFFAWVDPLQLLAYFFISIGLFVLLISVLPNPFKFVPSCIRINIQIGE